ncbi:hypothetical protein [Rhizobium sp. YTU87027]|uniref:hypothetical protein n=1 Tax=Rhizobium sp. YTU87027 TaxID=3417741 RepID=UPI003D68E39B
MERHGQGRNVQPGDSAITSVDANPHRPVTSKLWRVEGPLRLADLLGLVPQLCWVLLALLALLLLSKPAVRLLEEGRISKLGVGIFEIDIAQETVARIKDPNIAGIPRTYREFKPIPDRAGAIQDKLRGAYVLWVDDGGYSQNILARHALESFGIRFDLASATDKAFKMMDQFRYDAVISDVSRPSEGDIDNTPCFSAPQPAGVGCVMVKEMHDKYGSDMPPAIFYSAKYPRSAGTPPYALGVTNRLDLLFGLVFDALERRMPDETDR